MKTLLFVVALCMVQSLFAEDLEAKDGTVFQNVIIISATLSVKMPKLFLTLFPEWKAPVWKNWYRFM